MWLLRKPLVDEPVEDLQVAKEPVKESAKSEPSRPSRERSMTTSSFWPGRMSTKDEPKEISCPPPKQIKGPSSSRSDTSDGSEGKNFQIFFAECNARAGCELVVTKETQVPVWLLNACSALDYITSEHPKAMSIISAILITAGSIPAIPAIAAGAGGAVLASGAAQAAGAIAIGLGQVLNTTVKKTQKSQDEMSTVR